MSIQIKLKNSVVQDSTPSTSDLPAVGEIALNANINSIGGFMRASNNTIVKIFGPGSLSTPTATTTVSGISELATNSETTTGTATNRVVTPAGLNAVTVAERTTSNNNYVAKAGSTLTGVLTMPNGSNSAPAINFGDSDSGIFGGTNTVSLAAGGTTRLTADTGVSVTGALSVSNNISTSGGQITCGVHGTSGIQIINNGILGTLNSIPLILRTAATERARIDTSGRLLVGTTTTRSTAGRIAAVQIENNSNKHVSIVRTSNDNGGAVLALGKTRAGSIIQNNDSVGIIAFVGDDGTDLDRSAAQIIGEVDGAPGTDDMPGRLVFSTTADGAASPTTRLTIDSAGTSTFAGDIATTGDITLTNTQPKIVFNDSNNNPDYQIENVQGVFKIRDNTNSADRLVVNTDGHIDIPNNVDFGSGIDVTGAISGTAGLNIEGATVFNDAGADVDFRIEGDTDPFLFIADAGNDRIGINASLPQARLHVSNDNHGSALSLSSGTQIVASGTGNPTAFVGISILGGNSSGASILNFGDIDDENVGQIFYYHLDDSLRISTNASEKMRLDSSGRLMIGTSVEGNESADDFTVHGSTNTGITVRSGTSNNGSIFFSDATSGTAEYAGFVQYAHADDALNLGTASTTRMKIDSAGRVGIGCTPTAQFDHNLIQIGNQATLGANAALSTTGQTFLTHNLYFDTSGNYQVFNTSSANEGTILRMVDGNFTFSNSAATTGTPTVTERMRIDSSGNVCIGIATASRGPIHSHTSATTNNIHLTNGSSGTGTQDGATIFVDGTSSAGFWFREAGNLRFATDNSEKMRLDSSGRLMIGTTIEGVVNGDDLNVASSGHTGITIRSGTSNQGNIFFSDGTSGPDEYRGYFQYLHAVNALLLGTDAAERMRIDSAGRVGIGTSNIGSHQLVVEGGKAETGGSCLALKTAGGASGTLSALALYGTFVSPTSDTATRRTADITSGFSTGNWGTEFLTFNVGKSGSANDTQQVCDEKMRLNSTGQLSIGAGPVSLNGHNSRLSVQGTDFSSSTVAIMSNSSGVDGAYLFFAKQRSGSVGGNTSVANGDFVGQLRYLAADGTDVQSEVANISVNIDGAPGSNDTPGRITFATTNDGGNVSTERMRIDNQGNVGIGTSSLIGNSSSIYLTVNGSSLGGIALKSNNSTQGYLQGSGGTVTLSSDGAKNIRFDTNGVQRMNIASDGNVGIGKTSSSLDIDGSIFFGSGQTFQIVKSGSGGQCIAINRRTNVGTAIQFSRGSGVGSISMNNTSTSYNTSSDYRLKENVVTLSDAITRLKTLKPYRFNFIADKNVTVDGFLAHEVTAVPEAVTGTKDAVITQEMIDNKEYEESRLGEILPQGIDQAKLVPLLVAAVQELIGRVEKLEAA